MNVPRANRARRMVLPVVLLACLATGLAAQDNDMPASPADRVRELLSGDSRRAAEAADALAAMGRDALPALQAGLDKTRGEALLILSTMERIEGRARSFGLPPVWVAGILDAARAHYGAGRATTCLRQVEALRVLAPDGPWTADIESLAQRAREEASAAAYFRVHWEPASHVVVQPGMPLPTPVLRLRNTGEATVELRLGGAGEAPFAHLAVVDGVYDSMGEARRRVGTRILRAPTRIRLAPGESWSAAVDLGLDDASLAEAQIRRVHVEGRLRPLEWQATSPGGQSGRIEGGAIRIPPLRVVVTGVEVALPETGSAAGLARALEDARGAVDRNEDAGAAAHRDSIFAQALSLSPEEDSAGVDLLVTALDATLPAARRGILSALPVLTGRDPDDDAEAWILWWMSRR